MTKRWLTVLSEAELAAGARCLVKVEGRDVALFRLSDDELYAIDNQCPHEGYPLLKGDLCGTTLTCCYHNYKFDVRDGACLKGEERVQHYETRVSEGQIEVALEAEDVEARNAAHLRSLHDGLHHRRLGQVAREIVRLIQGGMPKTLIALELAAHDADHGEYGAGHGLAVAADALSLLKGASNHEATLSLMQAADMVADSTVRLPARSRTPESPPEGLPLSEAIADAIEREETDRALGLVHYALARGEERAVRRAALSACARHFLGFGHGLIYTTKVSAFAKVHPEVGPRRLWPGVIFSLINQTREDLLPEWRWFREAVDEARDRLDAWPGQVDQRPRTGLERLYHDLLDGTREAAFAGILDALHAGWSPPTLVSCLSLAASERIRRFDPSIDRSDEVQEGFLDVTHLLTFTAAIRESLEVFDLDQAEDRRDLARLLLQAARFIHNAKSLDDATRLSPSPPQRTASDRTDHSALAEALRAGDEAGAFAALAALCDLAANRPSQEAPDEDAPVSAAERTCHSVTFEDHAARPIIVTHLLKTARAAFEESRALRHTAGLPETPYGHLSPLRAYAHLATAKVRERWIGRLVHEAERFVLHGKVPRTLT